MARGESVMAGNRIRRQNTTDEFERLEPGVAQDLLAFNITKQRIVDLCNKEFDEDPLEGAKNYSSFHRALDGHEVYSGIVHALTNLRDDQATNPAKYLPKEGPGEDLAEWMAQFAKATWWYNLLDLEMTQSTLNAWFSGRGKRERPDVREQVEAWWAKLSEAVELVMRRNRAEARSRHHDSEVKRDEWDKPRREAMSWDTWCKDQLEDGLSMEEVREHFIGEALIYKTSLFDVDIIDLANPQNPLEAESPTDLERNLCEYMWSELVERDFACAVSRHPTEFDPTPFFEEDRWGDRRNEECPKDINSELYKLNYRTKVTRFWDAEQRCVSTEREIVAVSKDGIDWQEPTERQKQGWSSGFDYWLAAMDAGESTDSQYKQALDAASLRVRQIDRKLSLEMDDAERRSLKVQLEEAQDWENHCHNDY